jgi:DNA-binding transcriptional ArsR family regulator
MKNKIDISRTFNALAHKRRVILFELLLNHPKKSLAFGQLQQLSKIPEAPLAHHLRVLEKGGLIRRKVKGRYTYFKLYLSHFRTTLELVENHCA